MTRKLILAIDDETALLRIIKDSLQSCYDVILFDNAKEAIASIVDQIPDLIIVDQIMPGFNGLDFIYTLRKANKTKNIPIIMLTALKDSNDRILAYKAGVDDFISKPFNPDELLIRVQARIERQLDQTQSSESLITYGNLKINFETHDIRIDNNPIHLTQIELTIIKKLLSEQNRIISRSELEHLIWKNDIPDGRILDIHIATLRKKIKNFNYKIETIYGKGYTIRGSLNEK